MYVNYCCYRYHSYKIRYCIVDDVEMYYIADLLDQYNKRHHTSKTFDQYLNNKQTKQLLITMFKLPHDYQPEKWDIDKTIKYITYKKVDGSTSQDYVISREFLNNCLMWLDPIFAWKICRELKTRDYNMINNLTASGRSMYKKLQKLKNKYGIDNVSSDSDDSDDSDEDENEDDGIVWMN